VILHLLDELARKLDRLDVCPEGTAEDAFEKAFDLLLDRSQHVHTQGFPPRRV
jgi:hypothetical protein